MDIQKKYLVLMLGFLFSFIVLIKAQPMWPTFQYDNQRTGRCSYIGPEAPDTLWTYTPGSTILWSSPAIGEDGTIYFGCQDGYLYAINPDGSLKWTYMTYDEVASSPAIGTDGTIYFGSSDDKLYAIEDSITYGKLRWTYPTSSSIRSPILIGSDGTVYTGNMDAVDHTGNLKWTYNSGISGSTGGPTMSYDNSSLYVQHATAFDYCLACVDTNGSVNWERDIGSAPMDFSQSTPTVGSDGVIYFPTGWGGPLYAINPNSTIKWTCPGLGDLRYTSPGIGIGDTIYMAGGFGRNFHAITPTGTPVWTFNTANYVVSSPIIDGNGVIYIASYDTLFAINPDSTMKWALQLETSTTSAPAMDNAGNLYVCSGTRLYAVGPGGGPGIDDNLTKLPTREFALQIYPNPFKSTTQISYTVVKESRVNLVVYNALGQQIKILINKKQCPGYYEVMWDAKDYEDRKVPTGVYFVKFTATMIGKLEKSEQTKKLVLSH
jgi:outer membrane protein assembly factor BamB